MLTALLVNVKAVKRQQRVLNHGGGAGLTALGRNVRARVVVDSRNHAALQHQRAERVRPRARLQSGGSLQLRI